MMSVADLPPQIQERVICSIEAADKYQLPPYILLAVAEREGGRAGQWVKNLNNTHDIGPLQFNTAYLKSLSKYGVTPEAVAQSGCYSYYLAAWRIKRHIVYDKGDLWTKVSNYHSYTPKYNSVYRSAIIELAQKWDGWLKSQAPKHFPSTTKTIRPSKSKHDSRNNYTPRTIRVISQ